MQKIGGLEWLRDAAARSLVDARAAPLVRGMAGMTRFLHELVAGKSVVDGEPPVVGTGPSGEVGVDLSGPPWGPALLHSIASWSGIAADVDVIEPSTPWEITNVSGLPTFRRTGPWPIWVRPFEFVDGVDVPYSRGLLSIRAHNTGVSTSLIVRARSLTLGESYAAVTTRGHGLSTLAVTSTTETTFSPTDIYLNLVPGLNVVELEFFTSTASGGAVVDSVDIYQAKKLQH